jgi:hypothetical protein
MMQLFPTMAFIAKTSPAQNEMCKAVANLFYRETQTREFQTRSPPKNSNYRTIPCVHGANCRFINKETGEDTCGFANSIEKLNTKVCMHDERCYNYTTGKCTRHHPNRGQTKEEYAKINGFVFPTKVEKAEKKAEKEKSLDELNLENLQEDESPVEEMQEMQLETEQSVEDEEQSRQQIMMVEMKRMNMGLPPSDFGAECNRRSIKMMEDQCLDEIDKEIEEVCDEIEMEENADEFIDEVSRLYEDPDEIELNEHLARYEMISLIQQMKMYAYTTYGVLC